VPPLHAHLVCTFILESKSLPLPSVIHLQMPLIDLQLAVLFQRLTVRRREPWDQCLQTWCSLTGSE